MKKRTDPVTDAAIPKVGKLMTDMLVMALACDLTSVGTLMWADGECKYSLPWLSLTKTHRFYQKDGGFHPAECQAIATWYSEQNAYLLAQMANVDMGGHSLLLLQVHALLCRKLDPELPLVVLLQYPTIRLLARHLSGAGSLGTDHEAMRDRVNNQRQALARRRTLHGKA